jgi:hypothetical protein
MRPSPEEARTMNQQAAPAEAPAAEEPKKPTISPTKISMHSKCEEQFRRRYILGEVHPPGVALIRGSAFHKAPEINFKEKLKTGLDLSLEVLQDAARDAFDEREKSEGCTLTPEERKKGAEKVLGEAKDMAVRLVEPFRRKVAPRIQPVLVEQYKKIELPSCSHDLSGRLDLSTTEDFVDDFKTGVKVKQQSDLDTDPAMVYYNLAHVHITGRWPKAGRWHQLLDYKKKGPTIGKTLITVVGKPDVEVFLRRVNYMLGALARGDVKPATPGVWWCSPRWCGYWDDCKYVNSERAAAAEAQEV